MAVFLVIVGLTSSSLFLPKGDLVTEKSGTGGSASLISQARGAQVDSAALTVQSAPFFASVNTGDASLGSVKNVDFFYGQGAVRDPGQALEASKVKPANSTKRTLLVGIVYQIAAGDTLDSISANFNVPKDKIVQFNPSVNFSALDPGISIIVPGQNDVNVFAN